MLPIFNGVNYFEIKSQSETIPAKIHCGMGYSGSGKSNGQPAKIVYSDGEEVLMTIQRGKSKVYVIHSSQGEARLHQTESFNLGHHPLSTTFGNPVEEYQDRLKELPKGERVSLNINGTLLSKLED